ncbi:hypothetical protein ACWIUD_01900 [Helicobacter sp. 23-1044]
MGGSQTPSLASLPKIIKSYESHTAITSIVFNANCHFERSEKSPSLRENERSEFSWQSKKNCYSRANEVSEESQISQNLKIFMLKS